MTWLRKKRKYSKPRKLYDKTRIEGENKLVAKYGLKKKREIWKAEAAISRLRDQAKNLITSSKEKQEEFFQKLNKMGFKVTKIADVLDLNKENWLERRLQSLIIAKNLAKPKEARQLIAHKHVSIDNKKVNIPSYIVSIDEEDKIKVEKTPISHEKLQKLKEEKEITGE